MTETELNAHDNSCDGDSENVTIGLNDDNNDNFFKENILMKNNDKSKNEEM